MSRLAKFFGKPQEVVIQGEVFHITPFIGKDLDLLLKFQGDVNAEDLYALVFTALSRSENDITIEEVKQLPVSVLSEFVEAIMRVNGLSEKVQKHATTTAPPSMGATSTFGQG